MTRNYFKDYNLLAISANLKETALNTAQTLDTGLLVSKDLVLNIKPKRGSDNRNKANGKEEPDTIYDEGYDIPDLALSFDMAEPQHFAIGLGFGLGVSTPSAWGTGFKHLKSPTSALDLPALTLAGRAGLTLYKRRLISMFVNSFKATLQKNTFAKADIGLKGTGKYDDTLVEESITADYDATSLNLAANGVEGAAAATRLDNIHRIRVQVPVTGEWVEVDFSAVSGDTPAVITIDAPGGAATSTTYKVLYVPTEPAWAALPAIVQESPLRVTDLLINIGGKWDGSAILGGRTLGAEVNSLEYDLENNIVLDLKATSGASGNYMNFMARGDRVQTLKLDKDLRDFILQQAVKDIEYFAVQAKLTGAEFETGKNYYVDLVWPRCAVVQDQIKVDGKVLAESGDLKVLKDDTYDSVIATVANKVSGYAQAA